jgi:hypothetical protein
MAECWYAPRNRRDVLDGWSGGAQNTTDPRQHPEKAGNCRACVYTIHSRLPKAETQRVPSIIRWLDSPGVQDIKTYVIWVSLSLTAHSARDIMLGANLSRFS